MRYAAAEETVRPLVLQKVGQAIRDARPFEIRSGGFEVELRARERMQHAEIVNVAVICDSTQRPAAADTLDTAQPRVARAAGAADAHHRIAADEFAKQPRDLRLGLAEELLELGRGRGAVIQALKDEFWRAGGHGASLIERRLDI